MAVRRIIKTGIYVPDIGAFLNNTSLTEKEVKAGACGGKIIPQNAKKEIPPGAYILEFPSTEHITEDGKYIDHALVSLSLRNIQTGNVFHAALRISTLQIRFQEDLSVAKVLKRLKNCQNKQELDAVENYIKGSDKFPLDPQRWDIFPLQCKSFY